MAPPELDNLVEVGRLKREPPDQGEFDGLVNLGEAKYRDALNTTLAMESRFELAYGASHAFSPAALRWHG